MGYRHARRVKSGALGAPAGKCDDAFRVAVEQAMDAGPHSEGGDDRGSGLEVRVARLEAGVEHIDREVTSLRAEVDGLRRDMRAQFLWLVSALFTIVLLGIGAVAWANTKFEAANERMTRIEVELARFETSTNGRLARLDERVSRVEDRLAKMDERISRIEDRLAKMDDRMSRIEDSLRQLHADLVQSRNAPPQPPSPPSR